MDDIQKKLLKEVAEIDNLPNGAYNIRSNSEAVERNSTENIKIESKKDKVGINIIIKENTKNESLHIPVIISKSGIKELVYNDFFIGDNADVTIIAGCGIHNCGNEDSNHDGIHAFYLGKNAKVKYIEKHYGDGNGEGKKLMNPTTIIELKEGAEMIMESTQISGIDDTNRITKATLYKDSKLEIKESVMTSGTQNAISDFDANLEGENCSCNIISRTVARDNSKQHFISKLNGLVKSTGHSECDSIIMDNAEVKATPELYAKTPESSLIHEAAIGKIAGAQLIKLMTLGLTEKEAEEQIIAGFLR